MRPNIRAIVNADDLGRAPEVNQAIFRLMASGQITSATIVANGPAVHDAVARLGDFPGCSFGVHLNATVFAPVSGDSRLAPLLSEAGNFAGTIHQVRIDPLLRAALEIEFSLQIERLLDCGIAVSHIDSHHHIHTIPTLFPLLKAFQRHYGIRRIRISRNLFPKNHPFPMLHRFKKVLWNFGVRYVLGMRTTDVMGDLESFIDQVDTLHQSCIAEIMVHPGHPGHADEGDLLQTEWWADLPFDVHFITFREL